MRSIAEALGADFKKLKAPEFSGAFVFLVKHSGADSL